MSVRGDPSAPRLVISGTGRAGTTFLVRVLTSAGVDTGFASIDDGYRTSVRAGMETCPRATWSDEALADLPYVVKDPQLCLHLGSLLGRGFRPRAVVVPVRDLDDAACSRIVADLPWVPNVHRPDLHTPRGRPTVGRQREKLAEFLGELVATCVVRGVPLVFVPFATLTHDPTQTYERWLGQFLEDRGVDLEDYVAAHAAVSAAR